MSERLSIQPGKTGAIFVDAPDDGHGATGQVKKASFWGREVKVQGHDMNAGSLIDFLNTKVPDGKKLEKGWFFGLGGSSKKEIQALFDELYPIDTTYKARLDKAKRSFVLMNPTSEPVEKFGNTNVLSMYRVGDSSEAQEERITVLASSGMFYRGAKDKLFEGILLKQGLEGGSDAPTLHICLQDEKFGTDIKDTVDKVIAPLLEEAMEKLAELDLPMPTDVCCDYGHYNQLNYMEYWQQQNGRIEMLNQKRKANQT